IGDWVIAGAAARGLLRDRLKSSAELAAQNVPFFLETGQNLALQIASDPRLPDEEANLASILEEYSQSIPYFSQLVLFDVQTRALLASYPSNPAFEITRPEEDALLLAQQGVPNQVYAIPPLAAGGAAGV